jgi:hypothetical protein
MPPAPSGQETSHPKIPPPPFGKGGWGDLISASPGSQQVIESQNYDTNNALESKTRTSCGSGIHAAMIEAGSLSHKEQKDSQA